MPNALSVEDEETGQVDLSSHTNADAPAANNNIIQFWNVILLCVWVQNIFLRSNFFHKQLFKK